MEYTYKKVDLEGLQILDSLSKADKINKWTYDIISPFTKGKILEIGSGTGNISNFFILNNQDITLSDIRENYLEILKNKFKLSEEKFKLLNIASETFEIDNIELLSQYDTVFCLNVIEHIENDSLALKNMHLLLKENGVLIILVPAFSFLYNNFDKTLEHYRRYTKRELSDKMKELGIIEKCFYFNAFGAIGWWLSGTLLRKKTLPSDHIQLFNFLLPVIKLLDKITFKKFGISVICIVKK